MHPHKCFPYTKFKLVQKDKLNSYHYLFTWKNMLTSKKSSVITDTWKHHHVYHLHSATVKPLMTIFFLFLFLFFFLSFFLVNKLHEVKFSCRTPFPEFQGNRKQSSQNRHRISPKQDPWSAAGVPENQFLPWHHQHHLHCVHTALICTVYSGP